MDINRDFTIGNTSMDNIDEASDPSTRKTMEKSKKKGEKKKFGGISFLNLVQKENQPYFVSPGRHGDGTSLSPDFHLIGERVFLKEKLFISGENMNSKFFSAVLNISGKGKMVFSIFTIDDCCKVKFFVENEKMQEWIKGLKGKIINILKESGISSNYISIECSNSGMELEHDNCSSVSNDEGRNLSIGTKSFLAFDFPVVYYNEIIG